MDETSRITPLVQPGLIMDPLTEIAREGARQMLAQALRLHLLTHGSHGAAPTQWVGNLKRGRSIM
jgi:hypothetical protein